MLPKIEVSLGSTGVENHTIIAKSSEILEKLEIIEQISKTDSSVLILGESGVGKKFFAEQIHLLSPRSQRPFVRINCAAIPEGLLEHERFGLAGGGTVFLDEITELPLAIQTKLFRIIQERTFDIRILAASDRDIKKQVEKGEFQSDLYHRLNVLPLCIPPLRQRHEDIPELAAFFLKKSMQKTGNHFDGFSHEAMETMLSYAWPGNVRELKNCIERACIIGKGKSIEAEELFLKSIPMAAALPKGGNRNLKTAENVFRARFIRKVLEENNWNQTEAAKALGIQRTYLSRLIKELDINNPKE
jgi:Nif-specific regulatory protein